MRIFKLLVFFVFFITINLEAQININVFVKSIKEELEKLEKEKVSNISNFMEYGYRKNRELMNDNVYKIPVYSIFINHEFTNQSRLKDSLFVYLNPKSICIDHVFFYKDCNFIAVAYREYANFKDQPIGPGNIQNRKLANIAINEKPDLIFSLSESNEIFFLLKDNSLSCYFYNKAQSNFIQVKPQELLEIIDETEFHFITNLDSAAPLIYSK